mmetsp:Transcript_39444/g.80924  ORF Transcript_39444/g.80924 Transcript_39444/m.80924 type:complete len:143 (-) Transcript_39444:1216-1644(-)
MVFLTAAAVTAGAYGAYKGGEAAVKGAQSKVRDIKLERNGKKEYDAKSRERKERLSTITQKHGAAVGASAAGVGGIESSSFASAAGASVNRSAGGAASNNKSVEERLRERRSMKASAAAHGTGSVAKKKKGSSVLGRFSKKN